MKEGKKEYLQMIQEPLSRMSTISAIFKGFAATIVAGIATLSYSDISISILILSFVPVFLFAVMDVYYLQLEMKFKYLYEQVRNDIHEVDFSMDLQCDKKVEGARTIDCIKSPSIWMFYPLLITILFVVLLLKIRGAV